KRPEAGLESPPRRLSSPCGWSTVSVGSALGGGLGRRRAVRRALEGGVGVGGDGTLGARLVLRPVDPLRAAAERRRVRLPPGVAVLVRLEHRRLDADALGLGLVLLHLRVVEDDLVHRRRRRVPAAGLRLLVLELGEDVVLERAVLRVELLGRLAEARGEGAQVVERRLAV